MRPNHDIVRNPDLLKLIGWAYQCLQSSNRGDPCSEKPMTRSKVARWPLSFTPFSLPVIIVTLFLSLPISITQAEEVHIFVPSLATANSLQKQLTQACPTNLTFQATNKVKDSKKVIKKALPEFIISMQPVIEQYPDYQGVYRGTRDGKTTEPYILASIETTIDPSSLATLKIGVVDLLGRRKMKKLVSNVLDANIKAKFTTKIEDLFPLLNFKQADAIFVSKNHIEQLKALTTQTVHIYDINIALDLTWAAVKKGSDATLLTTCLDSLDALTNKSLGVEKWVQI